MTRVLAWWLVLGQAACLVGTFGAAHTADSFLPENGGSGDAAAIAQWNSWASGALWLLAGLWAAALVLAIREGSRLGQPIYRILLQAPRGALRAAVTLPVVGVIAGALVYAFL